MIERTEEEMVQDYGLRYVWRCPECRYEYEDVPGTNEGLACPRCGVPTERAGETYMGDGRE